MLSFFSGRVMVEENRIPLFLITLQSRQPLVACQFNLRRIAVVLRQPPPEASLRRYARKLQTFFAFGLHFVGETGAG